MDELPEVNCTVSILGSELATIQTVGVVTFSADLPGITSAEIQFGKDDSYGLVAPVDLAEPDYRTLLLGMTQSSTYQYRVAVSDGTNVCYSEVQMIETGELDVNGLAEASTGAGAAEGFIVTSRGSDVIIFDKEGELVWGYKFASSIFSARMSWDGKHVFARDLGPFDAGNGGTFYRVAMDGSGLESLDAPGGDHHDFTVTPTGIAYLAKGAAGECDKIFTASEEVTDGVELVNTWEIYQYFEEGGGGGLGSGELCHANRIHYLEELDAFTVSDREKDALAVFGADGTPMTSIGKAPASGWTQHVQAEGAGTDWRVQHGHHFYADDKLLVFSNNSSDGSAILHYTINGSNAVLDWKYAGAGSSMTQGDVQHLPNGNSLITASNSGVIHEIGTTQNLIGSYRASAGGGGGGGIGGGGGFGYTTHRATLYGAPASR